MRGLENLKNNLNLPNNCRTERSDNIVVKEYVRNCLSRLKDAGIIDCAEDLVKIIRMRNLLVHRYWNVDDSMVYSSVRGNFECVNRFLGSIEEYVMYDRLVYFSVDEKKKKETIITIREFLKDKIKLAYIFGSFLKRERIRDVDIAYIPQVLTKY